MLYTINAANANKTTHRQVSPDNIMKTVPCRECKTMRLHPLSTKWGAPLITTWLITCVKEPLPRWSCTVRCPAYASVWVSVRRNHTSEVKRCLMMMMELAAAAAAAVTRSPPTCLPYPPSSTDVAGSALYCTASSARAPTSAVLDVRNLSVTQDGTWISTGMVVTCISYLQIQRTSSQLCDKCFPAHPVVYPCLSCVVPYVLNVIYFGGKYAYFNPLKGRDVNWLHLAIQV